jgi:hypothetical protein
MELMVKIGAVYSCALIIFHTLFWKLFSWEEQLKRLSSLNKAIMQVLNISLTFVFFIIAYVSWVHSSELLTTDLGNSLLYLISVLWFFRAAQQVVFFNKKSWASHCFTLFFIIGGVLYGIPAIQ